MNIDAVILAAGEGTRLRGIVPTGLKPLLVVNGEPLIARLVRQARGYCDRIIVVVNPLNAPAITEILGPNLRYIVQPTAQGPAPALCLGLELVRADAVLMLAGDNYLADDTIARMLAGAAPEEMGIGVRVLDDQDAARRFTRLWRNGDGALRSEEGPVVTARAPWTVWCGPLLVPAVPARKVLALSATGLIGPYLEDIAIRTAGAALIPVDAEDIGTPSALNGTVTP